MAEAYPLQWPAGWPRANGKMGFARFKTTPERALLSLLEELQRLRASNIVISSNCKLRSDGRPYAEDLRFLGQGRDAGVAVYFQFKGKPMVMAQDAYNAPFANIRSLALAVEAMRQIERHGGGHMMQRSFEGFSALPPPGGAEQYQKKPWRDVLALGEETRALPVAMLLMVAEGQYKTLAQKHHPDKPGGSAEAMAELNIAIEEAREELKE